jgi:hypothetical protein
MRAPSVAASPRSLTDQTTGSAMGRHCHSSKARAPVAASTNVLRSIAGDMKPACQRLNERLAMTECCTANRPSRARLVTTAAPSGDAGRLPPPSMVVATGMFITKAIAHRKVTRKST